MCYLGFIKILDIQHFLHFFFFSLFYSIHENVIKFFEATYLPFLRLYALEELYLFHSFERNGREAKDNIYLSLLVRS